MNILVHYAFSMLQKFSGALRLHTQFKKKIMYSVYFKPMINDRVKLFFLNRFESLAPNGTVHALIVNTTPHIGTLVIVYCERNR